MRPAVYIGNSFFAFFLILFCKRAQAQEGIYLLVHEAQGLTLGSAMSEPLKSHATIRAKKWLLAVPNP